MRDQLPGSVQAILPGFFCARIKELAAGTEISSVPVMIKVGLDIFGYHY
jgi:hypothetical protein